MNAADKYADGYPVKLVRDRIGERLGGDGTLTYEQVTNHVEHVKLLRRKLIEEAIEYLADPSISELADVFEVVMTLARKAHPDEDLFAIAHHKATERGGFQQGLVMVAHHEVDGRELLPSPKMCGRLLVGRGGDTWDPRCVLPAGHEGLCCV